MILGWRIFTSETGYILIFNLKRIILYLSHEVTLKIRKIIHMQAFWSAIKYFMSLLIFVLTQLYFSRNAMNAHWKTQISKLLTLEVRRTMMNIIVLWYLHGITELQRSFWVSRHHPSWYCVQSTYISTISRSLWTLDDSVILLIWNCL